MERFPPYIALSQSKFCFPRMFGDVACHHHQILDHCACPASFYRVPHEMARVDALVSDHTQDVISWHRKFQYKLICVELPREEPFQIHICLDLAVILLAFLHAHGKGQSHHGH